MMKRAIVGQACTVSSGRVSLEVADLDMVDSPSVRGGGVIQDALRQVERAARSVARSARRARRDF
jgi:hypothetical protein